MSQIFSLPPNDNDSGPLHLACTTETPLVGLFGSGSDASSELQPAAAWRRAVRSDDMAGISPAEVLAASLLAIKAGEAASQQVSNRQGQRTGDAA